jgi:hypothetical protein
MDFDLNQFIKKYSNKNFIILYFIVFIVLFVLFSFIKFFSQLPILIIITFIISSLIFNKVKKNTEDY